jgi:hypothetical protein
MAAPAEGPPKIADAPMDQSREAHRSRGGVRAAVMKELAPGSDAILHEPARGRAGPGGPARVGKAEPRGLAAKRVAQDGLIELARPIVIVAPPAQHHHQTLRRGEYHPLASRDPPHLGDEPRV